ncbi:MAG: glucosyltransferase domain-containing protein [Burkholderiales bacterium]|nr:glucosyltransferase domain-containing protein [Burkholderiales bacterium]
MRDASSASLEARLAARWARIARASKIGFLVAVCTSLLAFGFEMTNLTLHHDDLNHLFVGKPLVGWYLGRFVHAWLFWYGQQGLFLPFLDMTVGIALMAVYGVLVARFWGAQRTLDVALVAAIVCVFPYMAHVYQYNSVMIAYPLAHLLAATGVVLAARARPLPVLAGALLLFVAFSTYQAVLANAVTLGLVWLLMRAVFPADAAVAGAPAPGTPASGAATAGARSAPWAAAAMLLAVGLGGVLHVLAVWSLDVPMDAAQGADEAFSLHSRLEHGLQLGRALAAVVQESRAFFVWPEAYLPQPLKALHALLVAAAALACLIVPRGVKAKTVALVLLGLALLAPRTLQLMHPGGTFHKLTLTAYALVIAGAALLVARSAGRALRSGVLAAGALLLAGYIVQCNWVSTVNLLNTQAHIATVTQVLARVRALPAGGWDGRTIAVVGRYDMAGDFPYHGATGVASEYLGARHMAFIARLLRDEARFVEPEAAAPGVAAFAAGRPAWPHPDSVGIVDGVGVVVLARMPATQADDRQVR